MKYEDTVRALGKDTIDELRTAVEIGRWKNGDKITSSQRDSAMQAVMLWEAQNTKAGETNDPFTINQQAEITLGKGIVVDDVPIEYKSVNDPNLIFTDKIKLDS